MSQLPEPLNVTSANWGTADAVGTHGPSGTAAATAANAAATSAAARLILTTMLPFRDRCGSG